MSVQETADEGVQRWALKAVTTAAGLSAGSKRAILGLVASALCATSVGKPKEGASAFARIFLARVAALLKLEDGADLALAFEPLALPPEEDEAVFAWSVRALSVVR